MPQLGQVTRGRYYVSDEPRTRSVQCGAAKGRGRTIGRCVLHRWAVGDDPEFLKLWTQGYSISSRACLAREARWR